jgi:protein gp37
MAENSKIGWTDHTFNDQVGCTKVSEECRHCYIGPILKRGGKAPFDGPVRTKDWTNPERWNRQAVLAGERRRVFTCSMSDFFHEGADAWRMEAWALIKKCTNLDWLILTKRPELALKRLPADWNDGYANVWMGVTCGCEKSLYRLELLKKIPARIKFVSAEPLLERMDFRPYLGCLDWIITGCERAAKGQRRVMDIDWVRDIDRQCKEAGVSHFFKQAYIEERGVPCEEPLLDGKIVQEFPFARISVVSDQTSVTGRISLPLVT